MHGIPVIGKIKEQEKNEGCRRTLGGHSREDGDSCCPRKARDAGRVQGLGAHGSTAQLGSFSALSSPLTVEFSPRLGLGAGMGEPCSILSAPMQEEPGSCAVACTVSVPWVELPCAYRDLGIQFMSPRGRGWREPGRYGGRFVYNLVTPLPRRRCLCSVSPSLPAVPPLSGCSGSLSCCTPVKPTTCFPSPHSLAGLCCLETAPSTLGWMAAVCFSKVPASPFSLGHSSRQYIILLPVLSFAHCIKPLLLGWR